MAIHPPNSQVPRTHFFQGDCSTGWHLFAAPFDVTGTHLFADGTEVASASPSLARLDLFLIIAPDELLPGEPYTHFGGIAA